MHSVLNKIVNKGCHIMVRSCKVLLDLEVSPPSLLTYTETPSAVPKSVAKTSNAPQTNRSDHLIKHIHL